MQIENLDLKRAKEIIIKWSESKPFITRVHLFGSRVSGISRKTGKPVRPDSDLDIAIGFTPFSNEDSLTTWICEKEKWHKELLGLLGFSKDEHLDLEHYDHNTPHVAKYLKDNSIVIYTSGNGNL